MNFGQAIASGFANYVNFSGRAIRSEYWYWVLFTVIGAIVTLILDDAVFGYESVAPLNSVFNVVTFLPSLAVLVRRLHDIDRTGWWVLIALTIIGLFVLIYWACQRGTPGPNRFGPDPLGSGGWINPPRPA
jgi:uncharacterized membrane protein YhaH (DUF805 family)